MDLCEVSRLDEIVWFRWVKMRMKAINKDFNCIFNLFNLDFVIVNLSLN